MACVNLYIIPSSNDISLCPETLTIDNNICITWAQFHDGEYNSSNPQVTNLELLPGDHIVDDQLSISHMDRFTMTGNNSTVFCNGDKGLRFNRIKNIRISGVQFYDCVGSRFETVNSFTLESSSFDMASLNLSNVTNATFSHSSFLNSMGVLSFDQHTSFVLMKSCSFINNTRRESGGAVHSLASTLTIKESTFEKNSATMFGSEGGAIYTRRSLNLTVSDSVFNNNFAMSRGGAIHTQEVDSLTIIDSQFKNNEVDHFDGGAVAVYIPHFRVNSVIVRGCEFVNNSAGNRGGAIWSEQEVVTASDRLLFTLVNISQTIFINNSARSDGGALFLEVRGRPSHYILYECTMSGNFGSVHCWRCSSRWKRTYRLN